MKFFIICFLLFVINFKKDINAMIRSRDKPIRNYFHTKEELNLTKLDPRIDQKSCNNRHPISVFIHSAGVSNGKYFNKRQSIRSKWVSDLKELQISVYFVIALNKNETINEELREEDNKYQDILQFNFIDHYYNLTLKAISILRWISKKCLTSTYILKVDDDVMVNSKLLLDELTHFKSGISGHILEANLFTTSKDKWHIPREYLPPLSSLFFVQGGAYMQAGNITHDLLRAIDTYSGYIIVIDDVLIPGIIAKKAGIPIHSTELIGYIGCNNVCPLHLKAVIYDCEAEEIEAIWSEWKSEEWSPQICKNVPPLIIGISIVMSAIIMVTMVVVPSYGSYYLYKTYKN